MPVRRLSQAENSTTGRFFMRGLGLVAPRVAERLTADLFCRPRRGPVLDPGGHRFQVAPGLTAWDWGEGPTVILAHGWNGNAAQMTPFVEPLVRAGHYVIAFDQPAHGQSSGRRATVVDFAEAILTVARRVRPVRAIIAHSLGATAAALALSRGLRADSAVLLAPPAEVPHFAGAFARALGLPPARLPGVLRHLGRAAGSPLEQLDLRLLAHSLDSHALILHDPADREVPFDHGKSIARAWPGARFEAMPGAGHTRILRDREAVRRAVEFIGRAELPLARSA